MFGMNVIKKTAVNELFGLDGFVAIDFREVFLESGGESELMIAKAGEFAVVVVAGIGAGESEAVRSFDGEVKLGGELQVQKLAALEIAKEIVQFADGGVDVFADLQAFFEEIKGRRFV